MQFTLINYYITESFTSADIKTLCWYSYVKDLLIW